MNRIIRMGFCKRAMAVASVNLALALVCGCATTTEYVTLSHTPQTNVDKIQGAADIKVSIKVTDLRTNKDNVAVKGMLGMGPVIARNDVARLVEDAIERELAVRGFTIAEGMASVAADLRKFHTGFIPGTWTARAVGEVVMYVELRTRDGAVVFSKVVEGKGARTGVVFPSGKHVQVALEQALDDAVVSLVNDQSFVASLLGTGKK